MDPGEVQQPDGGFRLKLKVHYNSDIRIVTVEREASFSKLVARISDDFGFSFDPILRYEDNDGDRILLGCQNDLNELVADAKGAARAAVVVFVQQSGSSDTRAPEALAAPTPSASAMQLEPLGPAPAVPRPRLTSSPLSDMAAQPAPPSVMRQASAGSAHSQHQLRSSPASPLDAVASALPASAYAQREPRPSVASGAPRRSGGAPPVHVRAGAGAEPPAGIAFRWRRGDQILGQGAFGTVYLGLNVDTGEMLAVKQLDTSDVSAKEMAALEHEISMLRGLHHGNIVRYYGTERTPDTLSILLEYVPGGSIRTMLDRFGPLGEPVVRAYSRQLLLGLEYLHRNGIAHRDIKGGNVLINTDGRVKLADFGASKRVTTNSNLLTGGTGTGAEGLKGTPLWMAPEVIREQHVHKGWRKADIWSVGCTVIEMATGKPPWSTFDNPVTAMYHIACTDAIPSMPPQLSASAHDFLRLCFRRDPALRPDVTKLLLHPFVASTATPLLHAQQGGGNGTAMSGRPAAFGGTGGIGGAAGAAGFFLPPRPATGAGGERSSNSHRLLGAPEHPTYFPTNEEGVGGARSGGGGAKRRARRMEDISGVSVSAAAAPATTVAAATTDNIGVTSLRPSAALFRQASMPDPTTARLLASAVPALSQDAWQAGLNVLDTIHASPRTTTADSLTGGRTRPSTSGSAFVKVRPGEAPGTVLPPSSAAPSSRGAHSSGRSSLSSRSGGRSGGAGSALLPSTLPPDVAPELAEQQLVPSDRLDSENAVPASGSGESSAAAALVESTGEVLGWGIADGDGGARGAERLSNDERSDDELSSPSATLGTIRIVDPPVAPTTPQFSGHAEPASLVSADDLVPGFFVAPAPGPSAAPGSSTLSIPIFAAESVVQCATPAILLQEGDSAHSPAQPCAHSPPADVLDGGLEDVGASYDDEFFERSQEEGVTGGGSNDAAATARGDNVSHERSSISGGNVSHERSSISAARPAVAVVPLAPHTHLTSQPPLLAIPVEAPPASQPQTLGALRVRTRRTPRVDAVSVTPEVQGDAHSSGSQHVELSAVQAIPRPSVSVTDAAVTSRLPPSTARRQSVARRVASGSGTAADAATRNASSDGGAQAPPALVVPPESACDMPRSHAGMEPADVSAVKRFGSRTQLARYSDFDTAVTDALRPPLQPEPPLPVFPQHVASVTPVMAVSRDAAAQHSRHAPTAKDTGASASSRGATQNRTASHRDSLLPQPSSPTSIQRKTAGGGGNVPVRSARHSYARGIPAPSSSRSPSNSASPPVAGSSTRSLASEARSSLPAAGRPHILADLIDGAESAAIAEGFHGRYEGEPVSSPVRKPSQAAVAAAAMVAAASENLRYSSKIPRPNQQHSSARSKSRTATGSGGVSAVAAGPSGSGAAPAPPDPLLGMHKARVEAVRPTVVSAYSRGQYARPVNAVNSAATAISAAGSAARPSSRGMHPPTPPVVSSGAARRASSLLAAEECSAADTAAVLDASSAHRPRRGGRSLELGVAPSASDLLYVQQAVPEVSDERVEQQSLPAAAASSLSLLRARSGGYRRKKPAANGSTGGAALHPPRSAAPRGSNGGGHFGVGVGSGEAHEDSPMLSVAWQAAPSEFQLQVAADAQVRALAQRLAQHAVHSSRGAEGPADDPSMLNEHQSGILRSSPWGYELHRTESDQWHPQPHLFGSGSGVAAGVDAEVAPEAGEAFGGAARSATGAVSGSRPLDASPLMWPSLGPSAGGNSSGDQPPAAVGALAGLSDFGSSRHTAVAARRGANLVAASSSTAATARGSYSVSRTTPSRPPAAATESASAAASAAAAAAGTPGGGSSTSKGAKDSLAAGSATTASLIAVGQSSLQHSRPHAAAPGGASFSAHTLAGGTSSASAPNPSLQYASDRGEAEFVLRASPVRLAEAPAARAAAGVVSSGGLLNSSAAGKQQAQPQSQPGGSSHGSHGLVVSGGGLVGTGTGGAASFRQPVPPSGSSSNSRVIMSATPDAEFWDRRGYFGYGGGGGALGGLSRSERAGSDLELPDPYGTSAGDGDGDGHSESLGDNAASAAAFLPALMAVGRAIGGGSEGVAGAGAPLPSSASLLWGDTSADAGGSYPPLPQQPQISGRGSNIVSPRLVHQHGAGQRQLPPAAAGTGTALSGGGAAVPVVRTRGALSSLGGATGPAWEASQVGVGQPYGIAAAPGIGGSRRVLPASAAAAAPSPFLSYGADHGGEA